MSWYDEVRYFNRGGRYDRGMFEPHTAAFAGPGLSSPGLLGAAGYVNWRERPAGYAPPERFGRYGSDYGYQRRRYDAPYRRRRRPPHPWTRGW
jgi:hypothetical protein